ncbi:MAG: hypothetical protein OXC96_03470 [Cyanobacteria bacterium MAG CAR1_bin_15]|nr:hypothetical protein [Cyanobacteria bacterium MAG CAR1_bin_15]
MTERLTSHSQATDSQPDSTKKSCCRAALCPAWTQAIASLLQIFLLFHITHEITILEAIDKEILTTLGEVLDEQAKLKLGDFSRNGENTGKSQSGST